MLQGPFLNDSANGEAFSQGVTLIEGSGTSTSQWTGHRIWPSSVVLLQHLHRQVGLKLQVLRVLELGCGLPLLGASLAALGAEVCSTDHPEVLPHVENAMRQPSGGASLTGLSQAARSRLRLRPLYWGERQGSKHFSQRNLSQLCGFDQPIDLIIGADLVYDDFPSEPLLKTLIAALRLHGGIAVLALQVRRFPLKVHLDNPQKVSAFLRQLSSQPDGWEVIIDRPKHDAHPQFARDDVENIVIATIMPAAARTINQCTHAKQPLRYLREDLPDTK